MNLLDCTGKFKCKSKHRNTHFVENGGNLLKELISSTHGKINPIRIFTLKELRKATNDFNSNRILGKSDLTVVYEGIHDDQSFAIKVFKYHHFFPEMFINEMVSLSQANHRNIQKLIGCCIETEFPVLVSELIPNGSLYKKLNKEDTSSQLQWASRLGIAVEVAHALAYLHTAFRVPITHGSISSRSILLDERFMGKLCTFGFSEMQKNPTVRDENIGKDIHDFGMFLLELTIEGKVPFFNFDRSNWDDILSIAAKDINEENDPKARACYELAMTCIANKVEERPNMKQIVQELRKIIRADPGQPSHAS